MAALYKGSNMKNFLFSLVLLASAAYAGEPTVMSINEIAAMQSNPDGTYDVICTNGKRETVTELDIQLNNACPHRTTAAASGVLAVQKREDGKFDVLCRDMKRVVAASEDILSGKACPVPAPKYELEDGRYRDSASYFCDQEVKTTYEGTVLTAVRVNFVNGCSGGVDLKCNTEGFCRGTTNGYEFTIQVVDSKTYNEERVNDHRKATFKKIE